jgi:hypothetical protein
MARRAAVVTGLIATAALAAALLVPRRANAQAFQLFGATGSNGVNGTLYRIDPATAAATAIGPVTVGGTGVPITGLAVHPTTGVLYAVTGQGGNLPGLLLTIDKTTGLATSIGSLSIATTHCGGSAGIVGDISFTSSGILYGAGPCGPSSDGNLYTIDLTTGAATFVGAINHGTSKTGFGLSFLPLFNGPQQLFVFPEPVQSNMYQIDPTNGAILNTITLSGGIFEDSINAATTDPAGTRLLGVMSNRSSSPTTNSLVSVDPVTGAITSIGPLPGDMDSLAVSRATKSTAAPLLSPSTGLGQVSLLFLVAAMLLGGASCMRRAAD